jgi:hypothetical protein
VAASAGLSWDIVWHTLVGRDSFLTPPHSLLYGGVALAGIVALGAGLWESFRGREEGTVSVLRYFRAPFGLVVTGFGVLTLLVSAPLDNYWHELYGIDITLWAPFHMMGLVGGSIAVLGVVYMLAAELARRRRLTGTTPLLLLLTVLFALSCILRGLLIIFRPATDVLQTTRLGPFDVLTLPVVLAFSAALVGVGAAVVGRSWPAATVTALMAAVVAIPFWLLSPGAVHLVAAIGGYTEYSNVTGLRAADMVIPLGLVVAAACLDGVHRLVPSGLVAGVAAAVPAAALGWWAAAQALSPPAGAVAMGIALAVAAGAGAGWLGSQLGTVWRLSER